MDVFQHGQVGLGMFSFEVHDLAADHTLHRARAVGDCFDDAHARLCGTLQAGQYLIRLGLQRVARQDGNGLTINLVAGRPAAAQVIVIQRGQIVMDQRVGMQHFQRGAQLFNPVGKKTRNHASGLHTKYGTEPLAAGEHAVTHRSVDRDRMLGSRREQALQRRVGQRLALLQSLLEHAGEYNKGGCQLICPTVLSS